jgi:hypothetical protein
MSLSWRRIDGAAPLFSQDFLNPVDHIGRELNPGRAGVVDHLHRPRRADDGAAGARRAASNEQSI